MSNQPDTDFTDPKSDLLLQHVLLEDEKLFTEENLQSMANQIFGANPALILNAEKENELLRTLTSSFKTKKNPFWLNGLFLIFALGIGLTSWMLLSKKEANISVSDSIQQAQIRIHTNDVLPTQNQEFISESNPTPKSENQILADLPKKDSSSQENNLPIPAASFNSQTGQNPFTHTSYHLKEESLHYEEIPTLSDAEKKKTEKQKKKMLADIAKRKTYASLPKGATNLNGVLRQVSAFSVQKAEVTNLEYRTFLNDLLIEGKHDEYLLAQPVKDGWKTAGVPELEQAYFTSEKYNDFPAVNMSRKGAELYCEWLSRSMKDAITKKEVKWNGPMPNFRLPSNLEWVYAARACDTTMQFPWGRVIPDSVQNARGCFLCNFNYTVSVNNIRTFPVCPGFAKLKQSGKPRSVITSAGKAIDSLVTAPVYSYNPNEKGLYVCSGNVSEMVWTWDSANPTVPGEARSMGGNWNSFVENVKIEAAEQYVGQTAGSAMIGFRPVFVL
jgi:formylglycine-generating enzyme required for sulfatase activity